MKEGCLWLGRRKHLQFLSWWRKGGNWLGKGQWGLQVNGEGVEGGSDAWKWLRRTSCVSDAGPYVGPASTHSSSCPCPTFQQEETAGSLTWAHSLFILFLLFSFPPFFISRGMNGGSTLGLGQSHTLPWNWTSHLSKSSRAEQLRFKSQILHFLAMWPHLFMPLILPIRLNRKETPKFKHPNTWRIKLQ